MQPLLNAAHTNKAASQQQEKRFTLRAFEMIGENPAAAPSVLLEENVQRRLLATFGLAACLLGNTPLTPPPAAPIDAVTDHFFGHKVVDRYRYFENEHDPRTDAFYQQQNTYTRAVLAQLGSARERLAQRIRKLDRSSTSVGSVARVKNWYFFERQGPQDEASKLYVRAAGGGPARLLLDPMRGVPHGTHRTIDWFLPSLDGSLVTYGISAGGSEDSVLHVLRVGDGKQSVEAIDRTRFGATGWLPDNSALLYLRLPPITAATPVTERERNPRVYLHTLGSSPEQDRLIFGAGVDPAVPVLPDDIPSLSIAPNSPYVIADIAHGVSNEQTFYAATIAGVLSGQPHWIKLVDVADAVTGADVHGSTIYFLSHQNAPNFRIFAIDLTHPELRRSILPTRTAVLEQIGVASDALYVRTLEGGIGHILRLPYNQKSAIGTIHLPFNGAITGMTTDPRIPGVTFGLTSWTHSLLWYRSDRVHPIIDTQLKPLSPINTNAYTSLEVKVRSADGTLVPLSIILKRGSKRDGSHPTYLEGYGAYGITLDPYFSATRMAWLERGGIYAIAHVRGGGEYGESWHAAAKRSLKQRSVDDYLACAHYLIDHQYTSSQHLAGEGTSAGGFVIGGAITQEPGLLAAALDVVGVSDALRSEFSANGPSNIPEFGTVTNESEFLSLRALDAYQQVKDGTPYPAVMLITGRNDPRVPSWELAKFTARLQAATTSGKPILLRVDNDGGHGFLASSRTQSEQLLTDEYSFLLWQLGDPLFTAKPEAAH